MLTHPEFQALFNFEPVAPSIEVAELKVSYTPSPKQFETPVITTSHHIFKLCQIYFNQEEIAYRESFYAFFLNRANRCFAYCMISQGGTHGTVADPKLIFQAALLANASNIVLAHNHPSGSLKPSLADKMLTTRLIDGGKLLEIPVLDHLIITPDDKYFSFADEGYL